MKSISLLLVDDHPVVRGGLRFCLAGQENMVVVGEASDGQEALRQARALVPDLVLMGIDMPQLDGLEVTEILHKELPHIKVLILSMHGDAESVSRAVQSGAVGYLLKESSTCELVKAVRQVQAGKAFFSPRLARAALQEFVRKKRAETRASLLTDCQREVVIHIARGLNNKEMAVAMNLDRRTLERHRERLMRRLNINSVAGLTRFALAKGYVSLANEPLR